MARREFLAPALLLAYGLGFAAAALGGGVLVFDDHPGQLYRVWHVLTRGAAPWAWDPGWWTGYPELQFYPPGVAYAGALLHVLSLGTLSVAGAYQALLWLAYLAPGATTFALLARVTGSTWVALPASFVALTFTGGRPGIASGVEGGVHIGMVGARLAWALLPLLLLALRPWIEDRAPAPALVPPLLAALVLAHPAALPAAVVLTLLAALAAEPRRGRLRVALALLALAAGLTGFWTVPLLARLAHTRALAWGALTVADLADAVLRQPLVPVLLGAAILGIFARRDPASPGGHTAAVLARFLPAMIVVTAVDRLVLEPLGVRWLPADRVVDGAWLALILAAGLGWARLCRGRRHVEALSLGAVALAALLALPGGSLALAPRALLWPTLEATSHGLRLDRFWALLREAPEGRILFTRSAVPLVAGDAWWRPHTHVLALAPMTTGRAIVNGTFTHGAPVASLLYRGSAARGPVTSLVERLDGVSIFGRPLRALDAPALDGWAERLGVSVVVVLDEDLPRLPALQGDPLFTRRVDAPPFVLFERRAPVALPQEQAPGRLAFTAPAAGWVSARVAYYPLWRASAGGAPLPVRRDAFGGLEVRAPAPGAVVDLAYEPGLPEALGMGTSASTLLAGVALVLRRLTRARSSA